MIVATLDTSTHSKGCQAKFLVISLEMPGLDGWVGSSTGGGNYWK